MNVKQMLNRGQYHCWPKHMHACNFKEGSEGYIAQLTLYNFEKSILAKHVRIECQIRSKQSFQSSFDLFYIILATKFETFQKLKIKATFEQIGVETFDWSHFVSVLKLQKLRSVLLWYLDSIFNTGPDSRQDHPRPLIVQN